MAKTSGGQDEPRTPKQELDRLARMVDEEIPDSEKSERMPPMQELGEDGQPSVQEVSENPEAASDFSGRPKPDELSTLDLQRQTLDVMRQIRDSIQEAFGV